MPALKSLNLQIQKSNKKGTKYYKVCTYIFFYNNEWFLFKGSVLTNKKKRKIEILILYSSVFMSKLILLLVNEFSFHARRVGSLRSKLTVFVANLLQEGSPIWPLDLLQL